MTLIVADITANAMLTEVFTNSNIVLFLYATTCGMRKLSAVSMVSPRLSALKLSAVIAISVLGHKPFWAMFSMSPAKSMRTSDSASCIFSASKFAFLTNLLMSQTPLPSSFFPFFAL